MDDIHIIIGGPQGGGLDTVMRILARVCAKSGYSIIADREYYSNIKGRHSYIHMRISVEPKHALTYPVNLFVSMDAESIFHHFLDVGSNGYLVYNTYVSSTSLTAIRSIRRYTKERITRNLRDLGIEGDRVIDVLKWLKENSKVNIIGINYESLTEHQKTELQHVMAFQS